MPGLLIDNPAEIGKIIGEYSSIGDAKSLANVARIVKFNTEMVSY